MGKRKLHKKQRIFILSVGCVVFVLAIVGVFAVYERRLDKSFHDILTDGLAKNAQEQKNQIDSTASNLLSLLRLLGSMEPAALPNEWELVMQEDCIHIDRLDMQPFFNSFPPELSDEGKAIWERLAAGEDVITTLGEPWFTTDDVSFALLHPVLTDGRLTSVLRAQIHVFMLTEGNMDSISFFQRIYTVLVDTDGNIVYANTPYPDEENLFSSTFNGGISSDEVQSIYRSYEESAENVITFYGKGNKYYMSWKTLGFNNWRLVNFARSPDVMLQTTTLVQGMILAGVCLIALTAVFCLLLLWLLLRKKHKLDIQQRRYEALSQFNDTLLFEYDISGDRVIFTPNALQCLDLSEQCINGISGECCVQHLFHPDDRHYFYESFHTSSCALGETRYLEARLRCPGGKFNWFGCQFKSIESKEDRIVRFVGKLVDIHDQHKREQLLRQAALTDVLTGIYNRTAETLINKQLEADAQGLFFMIDLDNFKNINDVYGHAAGDTLLISVAQILKEVFRADDTIARMGGDEFVAFISGISDPKVAKKKADSILSRMEELHLPESDQVFSASIGIAIAPTDGCDYDSLAHAADHALYTVKKRSKQGFAFYGE